MYQLTKYAIYSRHMVFRHGFKKIWNYIIFPEYSLVTDTYAFIR
jgi:hypothetical protein